MNIGEILQNEINSALVTFENHSNDNGFMDFDVKRFIELLQVRKYEPVGICKHVPFEPAYASYYKYFVAFCYRYEEELYWCHMTEMNWFSLLSDIYGKKEADNIISKIMNY